MSVDFSRLIELGTRGYCWSIGHSRLSKIECRVYPSKPRFKPIVIETGRTFQEAIDKVINRVGDTVPYE